MKLYGLKNCDATRKARKFLQNRNIEAEFVDFNDTPVGCDTIDRWLEKLPVARLFNARSATYRQLGLAKPGLDDEGKRAWLCKENRLIKRPVLESDDGDLIVGFDENLYKERFS
ncbi:arsenate reductase family protein [Hydrogenimonas sp.]